MPRHCTSRFGFLPTTIISRQLRNVACPTSKLARYWSLLHGAEPDPRELADNVVRQWLAREVIES